MNSSNASFITVVSGLPRSGTSLMMQMLGAGGMPLLTDDVRKLDDDNVKGYFEFEPVKRTRNDPAWVPTAMGKAVKVVYLLLADLPTEYHYRVLFLRRPLDEVIASQRAMLVRRGETGAGLGAQNMADVFQRQLDQVDAWLARQPCFTVLSVSYRDILDNPRTQAQRIGEFLAADLDIDAMCSVVDPQLYRQRSGGRSGGCGGP